MAFLKLDTDRKIFVLLLIIAAVSFCFHRINPVYDGQNPDGLMYSNLAQHLPHLLKEGKQYIEEPWFQRILPPAVIHYGAKLLGISLDTDRTIMYFTISRDVVMGFRILNLILFILTSIFWIKITNLLSISKLGKWLGFIGLIVNYSTLVNYWHEPVITDQSALFLGTISLFAYLKNNRALLMTLMVASFFTWPAATYYLLILLIFPRPGSASDQFEIPRYKTLLPLFACLFIGGIIVYIQYIRPLCSFENENATIDQLVPLSAIIALTYIYFGVKRLADHTPLYSPRSILKELNYVNALLSISIFLTLNWILNVVINASPEIMCNGKEYNLYNYILYIIRLGISRPFGFFVSHVHYFGPVLLVTVFLWKGFSKTIHQFGIGLTLFFLVNFIFTLNSETRQITWSLPFIIAFTAKSVDQVHWKTSYNWILLVTSVILSKIWLVKFPKKIDEEILTFYELIFFTDKAPEVAMEFPVQRFNMNYGPWMTDQLYLLHGAVLIVTAVILYYLIGQKVRPGFKNIK